MSTTENLEERLTDLEEAFDVLISTVEDLAADRRGTDGQSSGTDGPPAWQASRPDGDTLADWVAWFSETGYSPVQPNHRIPACWAEHPGMVAELLTLWHTWQHAFCNPHAEPEAAQNWHDRWLPGTIARIPVWIPSRCLNGGHPSSPPPDERRAR